GGRSDSQAKRWILRSVARMAVSVDSSWLSSIRGSTTIRDASGVSLLWMMNLTSPISLARTPQLPSGGGTKSRYQVSVARSRHVWRALFVVTSIRDTPSAPSPRLVSYEAFNMRYECFAEVSNSVSVGVGKTDRAKDIGESLR